LEAVDPEIRQLLDETRSNCDQFNINDTIERVQRALKIADSRGLIGDRALAEATLASAYIGQAKFEFAFSTFQRALQDAIDSKNGVLEADILTSLASEAQLKGNLPQAIELTSRALRISEKSGSLYEKARALGELGRMKLLLGKVDEAFQSIDEALKIDNLNGYRFQALHLVYRGYYLGVTQKPDQAIDSFVQAKTKALAVRDAYSFIMAENSYAFGLVQKGRADEAITELMLIKQGDLRKFIQDSKEQACMASALQLPVLHLTVLEGLTNVLEAANQKEKELEIWQEAYSYSGDHGIVLGEAQAAQKIASLDNQLKKTDDALKYYAIAADSYRKLQNDPLLAQVELSQALLLIQVGRGKEAIPFEQEVASYAKRHSLRSPEFIAYGVLAEIYQPGGDLERARDALEKALSLVQPGPFDDEIDNRYVLEDYLRLADVYRALKSPSQELVSIHKAFLVAVHLKDEKVQENLVGYLDQRLKDLVIRELVNQRQKEGQLTESLLYSCILFIRDGMPKPGEDNSNWNRILTLPFQIAQTPEGAKALTELLDQVDSFLGFPKTVMLDALARYYIFSANDPALAEKYALRSEEIVRGSTANVSSLRAESACVLAIAYSRGLKTSLAKSKLAECSKFAKEANDEQSLNFAAAANAFVQTGIGDPASARDSLEELLAKVPDNPELHIELAISLASSKLYEQAASQLDFAVAKLMSKGDRKTAAGAYVRVAIALNPDNALKAQELQLQYLQKGQRIYHGLNALPEETGVLNALGEYYLKLSKVKAAVDYFNKAYDLAQRANREDLAAQATSDLGNAYQAQKDFSKAREFHKRAAAAYLKLNSPLQQVISLESLAEDYVAINETDDALSSFLEARKVAERIPALNQYFLDYFLGEFYRKQGQFEKSLATFRESVEITKLAGDVEHCAYSHLEIAELDGLIGGWEDAVGESEIALNLFQGLGDKKGQAASWALLTGIYSDRSSSLKNFDKAQESYAKAQELGYGESLQLDLMEVNLQTGKYAEAAKIAKDSVQRCAKISNVDCQAHGLLSLSEAQRLNGEVKAARSSLNEARPLASKSQDVYLLGRLLYAEARLLNSEGKLDEALASYKQLIALIEGVKGKLDAKDQKSLSENYGYIYNELVSLLYSMSYRDSEGRLKFASESLEYAEINKAKQFVESWGRVFIDQMRRSLPGQIQETERSLFAKRDRLLSQLNTFAASAAPFSVAEKDRAKAELTAIQEEVASFLKELRRVSPQYAAVAYPEAIQIASLPLRKAETFVEFKMTDDSTFAWIVQNRSGANELVSFYKVPKTRAWFLDRISLLRKALNSGHQETVDWKVSEELFAALFPGEASTIVTESQDIIFIPDDVLFALPFELFSPQASKGDFVFLRKASTYYPSAVSFRLERTASHPSNWQKAFLGLADPITSSEDDRFEAATTIVPLVPQSTVRNNENRDDQASSSTNPSSLKSRGYSFDRLPGTAIEVRKIATLLQKTNERVEIRVGIDATKNELLDTDLSKFRFLHFATHGVLAVDTNISEPALVLSFDGVASSHMFLAMSEILGLKLQPESVVLSACNTGSGNISRAEGVMSLGRAFLAAGSSSVTVSLWQVSDESTAVLMEEYYRNLLSGKKKSVALAEARYTIFAKGFKEPFFWAPFILIGE
jgi:CHAT domain-containing protein